MVDDEPMTHMVAREILTNYGMQVFNASSGPAAIEFVHEHEADIIFMVLDGRVPDEGACVELGMAYAAGKRCYGLKSDARSVELDMDLNPMITGCFRRLFCHLDGDKLIQSLEEFLKNDQL